MGFRLQTDQRDSLSIGTSLFGKEQRVRLENGVQTQAIRLAISAPLVVTDKTNGVTINKGSLLAAIDQVVIRDGGTIIQTWNGRQLAYMSERIAPSQRTVVRAPATASLANTTYNLVELVTIPLADPFAVNKRETALMEFNTKGFLEIGVTVNSSPTALIVKSATNAALGTVAVSVEEDFDGFEQALPFFQPRVDQYQIQVGGSVNNGSFDLKTDDNDYLRGILIQEDTTGAGEQSDILTSFRLRDGARDVLGPNMITKDDYQRMQELRWGGAVYDKAYTLVWFQHDGRLSNLYKPNALRFIYNAGTSAASGAGTSIINIALIKCVRDMRKDPSTGRRIVTETLPAYLGF